MRRLTPTILLAAAGLLTNAPRARAQELTPHEKLALQPLASVEADARLLPERNIQGTRGFGVRRARLGLEARQGELAAFAQAELAAPSPALLDAFVTWNPADWAELTAGYRRHFAFPSGADVPVTDLPLMERSLTVQALWPGRDSGVDLRLMPAFAPVELQLRASNGAQSPLSNADAHLAFAARLDLVLQRLRLGVSALHQQVDDQAGVAGRMPLGYTFYRPAAISGERWLLTTHLRAQLGPLRLLLEGGAASEGRAQDTDGDPATPRTPIDPITSSGLAVELAWNLLAPSGDLQITLRAERLWLGRDAEIPPGGAAGGAAGARWWLHPHAALGIAAHLYRFDAPPVDDPNARFGWLLLARLTWLLNTAPLPGDGGA